MRWGSDTTPPDAGQAGADIRRPSRRAILRLAAGAALTGVAAVAGIGGQSTAYASDCTNRCADWLVSCLNWCNNHGQGGNTVCVQACNAMYRECLDCCNAGGTAGQCVPPSPPEKTSLSSLQTALGVSAELGYPGNTCGMLRSRAITVGPWEKFDLMDLSPGHTGMGPYALCAANGLFVSAELGFTGANYGMLRARASQVGPWETFGLSSFNQGNGQVTYALISNANGKYVSAEFGYTGANYGMLRARASKVGPWEQHFWTPVPA